MKFLLGLSFGALGLWAYQSGKLQRLMSNAPEPMQQMFNSAAERMNKVTSNGQVRIATPTAAEVAGRPSEPLPRYEP